MAAARKNATRKDAQDRPGAPKTGKDGIKVYSPLPVRGTVSPERLKARHGMKSVTLPRSAKFVEAQCNQLRDTLETRILELRGAVTLTEASTILTAVSHQRHMGLAARWLRTQEAEMSASERLTYSREITQATAARDRCIAALHLDEVPSAAQTMGPMSGTSPGVALSSPQDLAALIAATVQAVLNGQMDPKRAAALNGLIKTGVAVQDFAQVSDEIAALTDKPKGKVKK
jgi:hypothetical protein